MDAGDGLDVRDHLLLSTPPAWACRWERAGLVKPLLDPGADPIEADAGSRATPRAWAQKMGQDVVLAVLQSAAGAT